MVAASPIVGLQAPFTEDLEVCSALWVRDDNGRKSLERKNSKLSCLPGFPTIALTSSTLRRDSGIKLAEEIRSPMLDKMTWCLEPFTPRDFSNICALHHQTVCGQNIVITEDASLHLFWIDSRIFIKPIPLILLSKAFWDFCFQDDGGPVVDLDLQGLYYSAIGFLRSYSFLIKHESDFRIAQRQHLIPQDATFDSMANFLACFESFGNEHVCPRYHFGEIRLRRLVRWLAILHGYWGLQKVRGQHGNYYGRFYAPLLFLFAVFTVSLDAMQVGINANQALGSPSTIGFARFSHIMSIFALTVVCAVVLYISIAYVTMYGREYHFAISHISKHRQTRKRATTDQTDEV